ncbi:alpha/beta hydrolase [Leptolyngbya sp. 'hensonii']|uniref:alpha/beta fold hydrolase n=1 Tax=Leptolyngbya sp. 'hensonii' TaxID=1922337 RepID=UPI00094F4E8F|nr:alpha/beta fold hydrolase [Leptolyngbya sp. 'hensonii']OLP16693.1 alpha/beta hydrolase [Leptolyngbya sp. 'hensonii']
MTLEQLVSPIPLETQTWTWQGHQIHYTVMGTGRPLLLLHGFGASIGHWRHNIPVLAAGGYRVYAIDLLGFGSSDKPAVVYSLDLWQELVRDFCVEQALGPTVFVGNSIGGLLSLLLLAQHPELSAGAVLLNPAGGLNHRPDELNLPLRLVMGVFTRLVSSPLFGPWIFDQVRQKSRIRKTLRQVYRNTEAITDELVELLYAPSCDPGAQQVFASILTAPAGPAPVDLLPLVQHPLLVLWGEADPWTPIQGAAVYRQNPQVEIVPIPQTGHCPHDERPDVVNPLILDWLANLD